MNAHLAGSKEIDGVIVISAEYVSSTPPDVLADESQYVAKRNFHRGK